MTFIVYVGMVIFWCLGLRAITEQGMIGWPIRNWFLDQDWMPLNLKKPLILCAPCMSSFWGQVMFFIWLWIMQHSWSIQLQVASIIASVCCAFIIAYLWKSYYFLEQKIQAYLQ